MSIKHREAMNVKANLKRKQPGKGVWLRAVATKAGLLLPLMCPQGWREGKEKKSKQRDHQCPPWILRVRSEDAVRTALVREAGFQGRREMIKGSREASV